MIFDPGSAGGACLQERGGGGAGYKARGARLEQKMFTLY